MYDDVIGVKTGFTKKSGRCLVSASKKDGKFVIAVTLNDSNDWQDHRSLLDLGLSLIETKEFSYPDRTVKIPCVNGSVVEAEVPSVSINVTENTKVTYQIKAQAFLYAPISKGQKIGEICYYCDGNLVCCKDICANTRQNQNHNKIKLLFQILKSILSGV